MPGCTVLLRNRSQIDETSRQVPPVDFNPWILPSGRNYGQLSDGVVVNFGSSEPFVK